jgi:predicted ATPase with chaperone activity
LAVVYSRALTGMEAPLVEVEAHLANGLPAFNIVGVRITNKCQKLQINVKNIIFVLYSYVIVIFYN